MKKLVVLSLLLAGTTVTAKDMSAQFNGVWALDDAPVVQLHTNKGAMPPLRDAALKLYQQRIAQLAKGDRSFDPAEQCRPLGNPRLLWENGWPFDIQVTTKRILIGYTWNRLHRLIDVTADEPGAVGPTYMGTSSAQFQGDTLVVRSTGYNDSVPLDAAGMPHSYDMTLVERYRLINGGKQLQVDIRFSDDKTFTQPWETTLKFKRIPNGRIKEDVCEVRLGLYKETTNESSQAK
jgi:hypothetical protein